MIDWILIITVFSHGIHGVAITTIEGFQSLRACQDARQTLFEPPQLAPKWSAHCMRREKVSNTSPH